MSSEAADEVVRIALNGTEVAVRLAGSGVKNLASLLYAWSKKERHTYGETSMMKLLESGEKLEVLSMDWDTYKGFRSLAKDRLVYASFTDWRKEEGKVDVVFSEECAQIMNWILDRVESEKGSKTLENEKDTVPGKEQTPDSGRPEKEQTSENKEPAALEAPAAGPKEQVRSAGQQQADQEDEPAKKSPSPRRSDGAKARQERSGGARADRDKPSVEKELEKNRAILKEKAEKKAPKKRKIKETER